MRTSAQRYYLPKVCTPAAGRRKARIICQAQGCASHIIETKLLCNSCWGNIPKEIKREYYRSWRSLKSITSGDDPELATLLRHAVNQASMRCIEAADVMVTTRSVYPTIHDFRDKVENYLVRNGWTRVSQAGLTNQTFRAGDGTEIMLQKTVRLGEVRLIDHALEILAQHDGTTRTNLALRIMLLELTAH